MRPWAGHIFPDPDWDSSDEDGHDADIGLSPCRTAHIWLYDEQTSDTAADEAARNFQRDASREAGVFHHLITLPTYHTTALSVHELAKGYFGDDGMLAYAAGVQRKEIREGIACVKHQAMAGSDLGDDHKEIFSGENALKAGGGKNTMNQF